MTKKDYELIASEIYHNLTKESFSNGVIVHNTPENIRVARVAQDLAIVLQSDNYRFDTFRFFEACGLTDSKDGIVKSDLIDRI